MKTRESGMPPDEMWQGFFQPEEVLAKLGLTSDCACVVDIGCGYGTFALPAARIVRGRVLALDIDPEMVATTQAKGCDLRNLLVEQRDILASGCGLPSGAADYVMLFNLLHAEESAALLREAHRVLMPGGKLGVMHWNYDPNTPRGPSMEIRLKPEECRELVRQAGFRVGEQIDLPPYHYGFVGQKIVNEG